MKHLKFLLLCAFFLVACSINAQKLGFTLPSKKRSITIPFEQFNNLIVIPLTINNSITINFILDTGVQNAILTEKVFADLLRLEYQRKINISGPGIVDSVEAYIANGVTFSLPGGVEANNRSILVLEQDYLKLNKQLGEEVYGIIGHEVFSMFVTQINYDRNELTLIDPKYFKARKRVTKIPISVLKTKPYFKTTIHYGDLVDSIQLMIDTGASHALLLDPESDTTIKVPSETIHTNLGKGLGGDINGLLGRVDRFDMGNYNFERVLASYPEPGAYNKNIKRGSRSGTIGGELLARLNPTFDYLNGYVYLDKGKNYKKKFSHDMSGLNLKAEGPNLELIVIDTVRPNSPADKAGLKRNDIIKRINGHLTSDIGLSKMQTILRAKDGKNIKLKVVRDSQIIKKCFQLEQSI